MKLTVKLGRCCLLATFAATACTSPTRPGVSVASAQPVSPARDASISYYNQPVTLTMTIGVGSTGTATMTVEVAADAAFAAIVTSKPVAAGPSDRSSVVLDRLSPSTTYYWRIKTMAGTEASAVSSSSSFRIGPQEEIGSPTPVQPLANSFPHKRPTFTVKNAVRTGPSSTILSYRFEVGTDAGFANVVASGTIPEGADTTTFVPGNDLVSGSTYFWRARASDVGLSLSGAFSASQLFTTAFPDDGSYRYELILRSQAWCASHSTLPPADVFFTSYLTFFGAINSDLSYDGMLVVGGDALQYRFSDDQGQLNDHQPGRFELSRAAGNLTGTTNACAGYWIYPECVQGTLTGTADNRGRFDGTLAGFVMLIQYGIPGTRASYCASSSFAWTLLPK